MDTSGAVTLSRSHPKRTAPAVRPRDAASTTIDPSTPPTIDTVAIDSRSIESAMPRPTATALATTARAMEMPIVSNMEASTFWPRTASRRSDQRKVPAWIDVEMRLPNEPKMLPRRPMAAGTRTSRPG